MSDLLGLLKDVANDIIILARFHMNLAVSIGLSIDEPEV